MSILERSQSISEIRKSFFAILSFKSELEKLVQTIDYCLETCNFIEKLNDKELKKIAQKVREIRNNIISMFHLLQEIKDILDQTPQKK